MKIVVIFLLKGYKKFISPLLPPSCRYYPTCSEYAMDAVTQYGAVWGILMAVWRVLRCNPYSYGGYDPVPPALANCGLSLIRK